MAPDGDLLIGLGNDLRGDDGVGRLLAGWAERRWPALRVRSVQQLTPELAEELAQARRALFVDAWLVPPGAGPTVASGPCLRPLRAVTAGRGDLGGDEAEVCGAFSHGLRPHQLLALAALLYGRVPPAWMLLVPAFCCAHGEGLSAAQRRLLPQAEALLLRWCAGGDAPVLRPDQTSLRTGTRHA